MRRLWPILEPGDDLMWNWHIPLICAELEAVYRGETRELLICIPPGMMKSLLVSVFFLAWWWLHDPTRRFLTFANIESLSVRDAVKMRDLLNSDIYADLRRRAVRHHGALDWGMSRDQNQKVNYKNTVQGFRDCHGIKASITGARAHGQVRDDPHAIGDTDGSPEQIQRRMDSTAYIVDKVLPTRVNKPKTAWVVTIMQRVHPSDTAGRMLAEGVEKTVILQNEYDPDFEYNHPDDPRTELGELMFPDLLGPDETATLKRKLGPEQYGAQFQQTPKGKQGGLFKAAWFKQTYDADPQALSRQMKKVTISLDCSFKDSSGSSFVSLQVWGRKGSDFYLLYLVHAQLNFLDTCREFLTAIRMFPMNRERLVEDKANGPAVISTMKSGIPGVFPPITGIIPIDPKIYGTKYARAEVGSVPVFEAGNVHLPTVDRVPLITGYVSEHVGFPLGKDDHVDASSQYFLRETGAMNKQQRRKGQFGFMGKDRR